MTKDAMTEKAPYQHSPILQGLTLGKTSDYISSYAPELLQPVPRSLNRDELGLNAELPFAGEDLWNMYELSWLDSRGKPVVAVGETRVDASSQNLIESKSFKLYLNSLNQTRFASFETVQATLQQDLARCAAGKVSVRLYSLEKADAQIYRLPGESIDDQEINVDNYQFAPELLQAAVKGETEVEETLHSHLLKSNCLVTHQPDWGSVVIHYRGKQIDREALLRYLISFRQHNEFHEQCVERIFMDLTRFCQPSHLSVYARYTRRGGLDINPFRSNWESDCANIRLLRQ